MAVSVKELLIKLQADTSGVTAGLADVKRKIGGMGSDVQAASAKMNNAFKSVAASTDSAINKIVNLKSVIAVGLVSAAVMAADSFNQLRAKIDNVAGGGVAGAEALAMLTETANRTGGSIEAMGSSFVRLLPAKELIGATDKDLIDFIETIQKAGSVGGSAAQELSAAMYQLSQGIGSGRLAGEELRSVLEQMQPVAKMIADEAIRRGIIKSFGELKDAAKDGLIGPELVFSAILKGAQKADEAFNKLPPSVSRASNMMRNSWLQFLDQLNQSGGVTDTIATLFLNLSEKIPRYFKKVEELTGLSFGDMLKTAGEVFKGIVNGGATAANYLTFGFIAAAKRVQGSFLQMQLAAREALENIANSISGITGIKLNLNTKGLKAEISKVYKDVEKANKQALKPINLFAPMKSTGIRNVNTSFRPYSLPSDDEDGTKGKKKKGAKAKKSEAEKEMDRLKDQAKSLSEAVLMPWEKEAKAIAEADKLLKLHLITQETYKRAVADANKDALAGIDVSSAMEDWKRVFSTEQMRQGLGTTDFAVKFSDESNKALSDYMQILEDIKTPQDEFNEKIARLNELQAQFGLTQQQVNDATKVYTEELQDALKGDTEDALKSLENAVQGFGRKFEDTFIQASMTGKFQFKSLAASILEDIARILLRVSVINPIVNYLTGANQKGGGGGLLGKIFTSFGKIGKKATGGDTLGNRPYIVGEKGPELFMPGKAGRVMPNGQTMSVLNGGGSSGTTIVQNLNFSMGVQETVRREIQNMMPQIASQTVSAVNGDIRYGGKTSRSVGRRA